MLASTAALTLAGCAVAGPSGTGTAGNPASTASVSPASSAELSPEQRAQADVDAILADFAVPPGAKQLSAPPARVSPGLREPFQMPRTPYLVDKHSLWEVPGAPAAVLAWEEQHMPRQFTRNVTFHGTSGGVANTGDVFSLPSITDVLDTRELLVEVIDAGGGQTVIRVDAQAAWVPPKSADAVVPSAATVVTLSMNYGLNANGRKPPAPVTITDPATAGKVAALIDHVPPSPGGTHGCPADDGKTLDLAFRARPGGPVLATAVLQLSGCEQVDLTVSKQDYGLGHPGGARSIATQVLKVADIPWTLPPF